MTDATPRAQHRLVSHTSEVELHVAAPDLRSLYEEAARAIAELMAEDPVGAPGREDREDRVTLEAGGREELLVGWINEIVYLSEVHKRVYGRVHVLEADETSLSATLHGHVPETPRTAVKAATWYRLSIRESEGGLEARVVLDV